ncbi:nucleolar protein 14 isoform X1 [Hydra vulgaris]|uniref:nucleolar protein 14 isoform X1 n=1 Tax=Hydra vulgaris TaxID=6087 RepID=UPI001F5F45A9|nr:nucleolar protein 14-like [Hydra vulgaris]
MVKNKCFAVENSRKKKRSSVPVIKRNPFEIHVSKLKHDVIGKKVKTDKGLPGLSRSKANEKRKKTLLKEYKQRNKANVIIDRRFGEFDDTISAEEKMLKRFTLEKQRHHEKSSLYNLDDDDEEDLTHYGQRLADIQTFDDAGLKLFDENEEENVHEHFGGFLTSKSPHEQSHKNDGKKLTRQQIMDEIVANSKKKKFERQKTQEQTFELTQKLDSQYKDIQSLLIQRPKGSSKRDDIKPDDYDKTVKELVFEAKAQATNRLKSTEEIAQLEKFRLEELEKQRQMRMNDNFIDDNVTFLSADAIIENYKKIDNRYEVRYNDGKMILPEGIDSLNSIGGIIDENENESDDDQNESDNENSVSTSGDTNDDEIETGDDSDIYSDQESDMLDKGNEVKCTVKNTKEEKSIELDGQTLSNTVSLNSLMKMLKDCKSNQDVLTVLNNLYKQLKINGSKKTNKINHFFDVLLNYFDYVCDMEKPKLSLVNDLSGFMQQLMQDIPKYGTSVMQEKLKNIFKKISLQINSKGNSNMFPTLKELLFLKLISLLYPTSDLNHSVTTPSLVLIAMVMNKCHFKCFKDVYSGIFLLSILYDYIKLSKRYIPEAICFVSKLLYLATPMKKKTSFWILNLHKEEQNYLMIKEKITKNVMPVSNVMPLSISLLASDIQENISTRLSCIKNILLLSKMLCILYIDLETFSEVFQPCSFLLEQMPTDKYPKTIKSLHEEVLSLMRSKNSLVRTPLTLHARKPIPLPLFEPKFDVDYEPRSKRRAGDKNQNEKEKIKYKIKKETKSAMREIRKDAHFLAKEQLKETLDRDADRRKKVRALENALSNERKEIREMQKSAKKMRK